MEFCYDTPGLLYDGGATYDSASPPQLKNKRMQVKLGLNRLSPAEKVALTNTIVTAMTGNANFGTPNPPLATLTTKATTLNAKIGAVNTAKASYETALAERDDAEIALDADLTQEGAYVENASGGDKAKIESAGMGVRAPRTPPTVPAQVMNLVLTAGDFTGSLDVAFDPTNGSKSYEVQTCADPLNEANWMFKGSFTKSSGTVDGLTSGSKQWVRVRAVGAAGVGPWSDPATKVVP